MNEESAETAGQAPAEYDDWVEQWTKRVAQWQARGQSQAGYCR